MKSDEQQNCLIYPVCLTLPNNEGSSHPALIPDDNDRLNALNQIEHFINCKLQQFSYCKISSLELAEQLNLNLDTVKEILKATTGSSACIKCRNTFGHRLEKDFKILLTKVS